MKKAVLCFAHRSPEILNVQLRQLLHNTECTDIYIHLDLKSMWMKDEIIQSPHIYYIKNNVDITWGDDSMMRALFNSWEEIRISRRSYDYFIMTTGQDLLVREDIDEYLIQNKGKIWLDASEQNNWRQLVLKYKFPKSFCRDLSPAKYFLIRALRSLYYRCLRYGIAPQRKLEFDLSSIKLYYSFNWCIMPFDVFEYCSQYINENEAFRAIYQNTILPEDSFLATLIMNSPHHSKVVLNDDMSFVTNTYHSAFTVHPKVLTMDDIDAIAASKCLFARKFDERIDLDVINYYKDRIIKS